MTRSDIRQCFDVVMRHGTRNRGSNAILTALSGAGLATLSYICAVVVIAPDLALAWPLLAVFIAAAVSSVAGFAFAPICAVDVRASRR